MNVLILLREKNCLSRDLPNTVVSRTRQKNVK